MEVTATTFKAACLSLIDLVDKNHEPILITKQGEVVAQLTGPPPRSKPWFELRGTGVIRGDLRTPLMDETEMESATGRELKHGERRKK